MCGVNNFHNRSTLITNNYIFKYITENVCIAREKFNCHLLSFTPHNLPQYIQCQNKKRKCMGTVIYAGFYIIQILLIIYV